MSHIQTSAPKVNRLRTAYFKFYADDFLTGCRKSGMTPEQVGLYVFLLALEWQDKAPLEDDVRVLSIRTGWDVRTVRRILNSLVQLGKYYRKDGSLSNQRMQDEIEIYVASVKAKEARLTAHCPVNEATLTKHRGDIKPTLTPDLSEKRKEIKDAAKEKPLYARAIKNQNQNQNHISSSISKGTDADALKALHERLLEACNGSLDNPANCSGLLSMAEPQMWLEQGCDLEKDIIPTLRAVGTRSHGKRVNSWRYFTKAIADAKKAREKGLTTFNEDGELESKAERIKRLVAEADAQLSKGVRR